MSLDQILATKAERYIKEHSRELIKHFADPDRFASSRPPVSLFMAGSPGAGKTEFSKRLVEQFSGKPPVRIDADEIRDLLPGYNGTNASLFQKACTIGVNKLLNHVIKKDIDFILDGTFAYAHAASNIERSLQHGRKVEIYYLWQDPRIAWRFTQAREAEEGRRVTKNVFVSAFLAAQKNVRRAKDLFQDSIEINLIIKNFETDIETFIPNIHSLEELLPKRYTQEDLENAL